MSNVPRARGGPPDAAETALIAWLVAYQEEHALSDAAVARQIRVSRSEWQRVRVGTRCMGLRMYLNARRAFPAAAHAVPPHPPDPVAEPSH